jgi:hypothetical protein
MPQPGGSLSYDMRFFGEYHGGFNLAASGTDMSALDRRGLVGSRIESDLGPVAEAVNDCSRGFCDRNFDALYLPNPPAPMRRPAGGTRREYCARVFRKPRFRFRGFPCPRPQGE